MTSSSSSNTSSCNSRSDDREQGTNFAPQQALVAHHGLSYLAFAVGFIFPCAQRCLSSRESFLRVAALNLRRRLGLADF